MVQNCNLECVILSDASPETAGCVLPLLVEYVTMESIM